MDAAYTPPNGRGIPMDIVEEILCKLPVKSLTRFRCVSKAWDSKISESRFIRKHLAGANLSNKRLIINHFDSHNRVQTAFSCPLSSKSNEPSTEHTTSHILHRFQVTRPCPVELIRPSCERLASPFRGDVKLRASCDELWCVEVEKSLFLWNPSTRAFRKIADPPQPLCTCNMYGMGYVDSVGNSDCKLLIVSCLHNKDVVPKPIETMLYSSRTDAWKKVQPFPGKSKPKTNAKFVNGALHWMVYDISDDQASPSGIISFDLSTEKYAEVAQPEYSPAPRTGDNVQITVLKGMLCVFVNYKYKSTAFALWVLKNYGVEESWTKMYDIRRSRICFIEQKQLLVPLYLYEDEETMILVRDGRMQSHILVYKDELVKKQPVDASEKRRFCDAFVYVESLISPTMWTIEGA